MPSSSCPDTRARIKTVALELFASQGFDKTSLRQIADRLGFTKAALYYHFPSKVDLLRDLAQPILDDIEALLNEWETADNVSPRAFLESYFDLTYRHREMYFALVRDPGAMTHLDLVPRFLRFQQRFLSLLVGPDAPPRQQARAIVAIGGLQDCVILWRSGLSVEELREAALDAACAALGCEVEQARP